MAITVATVSLSKGALAEIQQELRGLDLDGWLLYDFRGTNPIAGGVLGLPSLTRRYFVFIPARGSPVAITHRIEQQPWSTWIGENRTYLSWMSLEDALAATLAGARRLAAEHSPSDAVPYLDRLPGGVAELVGRTGVEVVPSGDLVSAFYSRWTPAGLAGHLAAASILRDAAHLAFEMIAHALHAEARLSEWELRTRIVAELESRGLVVGTDAIVAVNANAANPHFAPAPDQSSVISKGDLILIDLWGKETPDAIFADQTWMGYVGERVPARVQELWTAIRDAREAAVDFLRERHAAGDPVAGCEVDDVARRLISERGHGDAFIHRTGHSIDRELHGSGPNIDNLETRDDRRLIRGIGFSIEPGIYYPGEIGLRTEIDVFMSDEGPMVTTPSPQREMYLIQ